MKMNRRDFLKLGCLSVVGLMGAGMAGCSQQASEDEAGSSSEEQAEKGNDMNKNDTDAANASSQSEASGAAAASAAVVYFSCTGNTESVAEKIANATSGTLMRIEPAEPYTSADLDYNSDCRANTEQNSGSARPALATPIPNIAGYDTVYLGYPIWWGEAPRVVLTFLEGADCAGKTIVPFCTSGSSPISGSIAEIRQTAPDADVMDGRRLAASASQQEIDSWVSSL